MPSWLFVPVISRASARHQWLPGARVLRQWSGPRRRTNGREAGSNNGSRKIAMISITPPPSLHARPILRHLPALLRPFRSPCPPRPPRPPRTPRPYRPPRPPRTPRPPRSRRPRRPRHSPPDRTAKARGNDPKIKKKETCLLPVAPEPLEVVVVVCLPAGFMSARTQAPLLPLSLPFPLPPTCYSSPTGYK